MKLSLSCLILVLIAVVISLAEPHYPYEHGYVPSYYQSNQQAAEIVPNYFRTGSLGPSIGNNYPDNRLIFGTYGITVATTTLTTTTVISTTCTTSTSALSICIASARRRRGFIMEDGKAARGLFYNEGEVESDMDSIFYPHREPKQEALIDKEVVPETNEVLVPFIVQPGISLPDERAGRFLLSFRTSTIYTTTTSTYTAILTAKCRSLTNFKICSGTGK